MNNINVIKENCYTWISSSVDVSHDCYIIINFRQLFSDD